jgi:hypothetical protein
MNRNESLTKAEVIGFFSLPSAELAEHNPTAYNLALQGAPAGAGSCSHCGTGILHHVVIRDGAGVVRFIGQDCAQRIGLDREQIRYRLTDEQKAKRDQDRAAAQDERSRRLQAERDERAAYMARRRELVGDICRMLLEQGSDFHRSLAEQLAEGPLSPRQAFFVAKATSATGRRNKRNAEAWDEVEARCQEETER